MSSPSHHFLGCGIPVVLTARVYLCLLRVFHADKRGCCCISHCRLVPTFSQDEARFQGQSTHTHRRRHVSKTCGWPMVVFWRCRAGGYPKLLYTVHVFLHVHHAWPSASHGNFATALIASVPFLVLIYFPAMCIGIQRVLLRHHRCGWAGAACSVFALVYQTWCGLQCIRTCASNLGHGMFGAILYFRRAVETCVAFIFSYFVFRVLYLAAVVQVSTHEHSILGQPRNSVHHVL